MKIGLLILILPAAFAIIPITSFAEQPIKTEESEDSFHEGTIQWISRCNAISSNPIVRVIDYDMNKDPKIIEQFDIEVWSDSENRIINYTVAETDNDTGVFDSTVFLSTSESPGQYRVQTFVGDIVFAKYFDQTIPDTDETGATVIDTFVVSELSVLEWGDEGLPRKLAYDSCTLEYLEKNKDRQDKTDIFYPSPLKQFKSGLFQDEIKCKEPMVRISNYHGVPACVKHGSVQKLSERGWTAETKQNQEFTDTDIVPVWQYNTEGKISTIRISNDNSKVAIGSHVSDNHGKISLFDADNGSLLWDHTLDRKIDNVAMSPDGSYVAVSGFQLSEGRARVYQNGTVSLLDSAGSILWTYNADDSKTAGSLWINADGSKVMFGTNNKITSVDRQGDIVWQTDAEQFFESVTFSSEGNFAASSGPEVLFFDDNGEQLWSFTTKYESNYATVISQDVKNVVVSDSSGSDGNIYYLDSDGNLLWEHHMDEAAQNFSLTQDNSHLTASNNWQFMMFDNKEGRILWKNNIPSDVAMSSDGSFIVGTTFNQSVGPAITFFDINGDITSNSPLENHILFSLSNDDRYLAVAEGQDRDKLTIFDVMDLMASQNKIDLSEMQMSSDLHVMAILQDQKYSLDVTVDQGQTIQIPWDINVDEGYTTTNLSVSAESSHAELESWIIPHDPHTTINYIPPSDKVITIHTSSGTPVGSHVVNIVGNGHSVHDQTGWMTSLENKVLGKINVLVNPSDDSLLIDVGKPIYERQSFCISEESDNSRTCGGGPTYQKVPITVFSDKPQTINLDATITQKGGWIKFIPDELKTGSNGATSEMVMAGYLIPFGSNPLAEQPLIIEATAEDGETATEVIPVRFGEISVINDEGPSAISLNKIRTNSNGTNFAVSGAVYDSSANAEPLHVSLSVLGLWNEIGGEITDLPTWLLVEIPEPSFSLDANIPHHFSIVAKTAHAPEFGTYYVAINQSIGDQSFVELQEITIWNRR